MTSGEWLKNHLWQIITGASILVNGILIGHATNVMRIDQIEKDGTATNKRIDAMEAKMSDKLGGRHEFMNDAASRVNFLCQESPDCRQLYSALRVPE